MESARVFGMRAAAAIRGGGGGGGVGVVAPSAFSPVQGGRGRREQSARHRAMEQLRNGLKQLSDREFLLFKDFLQGLRNDTRDFKVRNIILYFTHRKCKNFTALKQKLFMVPRRCLRVLL